MKVPPSAPRWAWRLRWLCVLAAALALLSACGAGVSQTAQTGRYQIKLELDGLSIGTHTAMVEVQDLAGQPAAADQVLVSAVMREMGMAMPDLQARELGPGRYQAAGELFSMSGAWDVDVRVSAGGVEDVATFRVEVPQ